MGKAVSENGGTEMRVCGAGIQPSECCGPAVFRDVHLEMDTELQR